MVRRWILRLFVCSMGDGVATPARPKKVAVGLMSFPQLGNRHVNKQLLPRVQAEMWQKKVKNGHCATQLVTQAKGYRALYATSGDS